MALALSKMTRLLKVFVDKGYRTITSRIDFNHINDDDLAKSLGNIIFEKSKEMRIEEFEQICRELRLYSEVKEHERFTKFQKDSKI